MTLPHQWICVLTPQGRRGGGDGSCRRVPPGDHH
uniref:Uncharacterized protein n=1 Tax=Triticum urartu TaxID=4572 RepID=A0A8R7V3N8_TRIUA